MSNPITTWVVTQSPEGFYDVAPRTYVIEGDEAKYLTNPTPAPGVNLILEEADARDLAARLQVAVASVLRPR